MSMVPPAPRKPVGRRALEQPYQLENEASRDRAMARGKMPRTLTGFLRWYSEGWDAEVPTSLHKAEVWRDYGTAAEGGSKLGAKAHTDPFRRYLENTPSEINEDGYYLRPMHAALSRLSRRWPLTARALFAVAQSGYDWRGVAVRGGWADEMFAVYLTQALAQLWTEWAAEVVRLD